jgi:outer membrane protein assembly factor BamA
MKGLLVLLFCFCLGLVPARGQQKGADPPPVKPSGDLPAPAARPTILVLTASDAGQAVLGRYKYEARHPDSLSARQQVRTLTRQLQQDGYLTASADTFYFRRDTAYVHYYVGDRFRWAYLRADNPGDDFWSAAGFKEKYYRQSPVSTTQFGRLQDEVLTAAENSGYPFARLQLDSLHITQGAIAGVIRLERGPLVVFDSLEIVGSSRAGRRFLSRYLQIYPGQPFSQQKVDRAGQLLRALPYVTIRQPAQVGFSRDRARVYLSIDEKKANQFDGIVGFLPDPRRNGKLLINGEVNLEVRNIRGSGKQLGLQWRKVAQASQVLDASYLHPNLLGSPFELGTTFNLYKQDSTFLTLRPRIQLSYYTGQGSKVSFFSEVRSSRLLLSAPGVLSRKDTLADIRYNAFGMAWQHRTLDDLYFPKSGFLADAQLAMGNKTVLQNPAYEAGYYDTLDLKSTQVSGAWRGEYFWQVARNGVLLTRLQGEALFNQRLFRNDLFRIGGLNSIRGFPDFAFYASTYGVGTLEYRLYTAADSYVLLFFDQGYYRRDLPQDKTQQYPFGLGGGISFSTGAGIFQFIYSVGRSRELNQPVSLNFSRIHFGIVSRF